MYQKLVWAGDNTLILHWGQIIYIFARKIDYYAGNSFS